MKNIRIRKRYHKTSVKQLCIGYCLNTLVFT
eukprot:UN11245